MTSSSSLSLETWNLNSSRRKRIATPPPRFLVRELPASSQPEDAGTTLRSRNAAPVSCVSERMHTSASTHRGPQSTQSAPPSASTLFEKKTFGRAFSASEPKGWPGKGTQECNSSIPDFRDEVGSAIVSGGPFTMFSDFVKVLPNRDSTMFSFPWSPLQFQCRIFIVFLCLFSCVFCLC